MAKPSLVGTEGRGISQGLWLHLRAPLKTSLTTSLPVDGQVACIPSHPLSHWSPHSEGCHFKRKKAPPSAILIASCQSPLPSSTHGVTAVTGGHSPANKGDRTSDCTQDTRVDCGKGPAHTRSRTVTATSWHMADRAGPPHPHRWQSWGLSSPSGVQGGLVAASQETRLEDLHPPGLCSCRPSDNLGAPLHAMLAPGGRCPGACGTITGAALTAPPGPAPDDLATKVLMGVISLLCDPLWALSPTTRPRNSTEKLCPTPVFPTLNLLRAWHAYSKPDNRTSAGCFEPCESLCIRTMAGLR